MTYNVFGGTLNPTLLLLSSQQSVVVRTEVISTLVFHDAHIYFGYVVEPCQGCAE